MDPLVVGLAAAVALLFGAVGYIGRGSVERSRQRKAVAAAADEASGILARAREEAENLRTSRVLEGKEQVIRLRESWEQEEAKHREGVERADERISERSSALDRRFHNLNERESTQEKRAKELEARTEGLATQTLDLEQDRERTDTRRSRGPHRPGDSGPREQSAHGADPAGTGQSRQPAGTETST